MTPDLVIDKLGGTGELAKALSLEPPVVSNWRSRGIPPGRWPGIAQIAAERGVSDITLDALARLESPSVASANEVAE